MITPARMQLRRAKGFRLQAASIALNGLNAVKVDRTTPFGNPYQAGADGDGDRAYLVGLFRLHIEQMTNPHAAHFRVSIRHELRGHNLACWCPLDGACHADVLLELANA